MYLRKVHIENIRSIAKLDWEIPQGQEAGWHVVIGDNGAGKTTFLRAVALTLVGTDEVKALRQNWGDWLRKDAKEGTVQVELLFDSNIDRPIFSLACNLEVINYVSKGLIGRHGYNPPKPLPDMWERELDKIANKVLRGKETMTLGIRFEREEGFVSLAASNEYLVLVKFLAHTRGSFSAAYGPFRRFTGGDDANEKISSTNSRLVAHLSIFGENIALTESLRWLKELKFKQLEQKLEGDLLNQIIAFVNQKGFLPHQARLTDISSEGVLFNDGDSKKIPVEELSDGYRSVLSMTFELIRQMSHSFTPEQLFSADFSQIIAPGVVLIDEVDAHLHPTWQRRIGLWFREHFPNIQFIVTTHSPLVCQAAEHGTVWRLPKPGSGENAEMVKGIALNRLLYGDVLDAYGTELFGEDVERSDAGRLKMQELAELNVKEVNVGLSKAEQKKQQELRAILPATTYTPDSAAVNGKHKGKRK